MLSTSIEGENAKHGSVVENTVGSKGLLPVCMLVLAQTKLRDMKALIVGIHKTLGIIKIQDPLSSHTLHRLPLLRPLILT